MVTALLSPAEARPVWLEFARPYPYSRRRGGEEGAFIVPDSGIPSPPRSRSLAGSGRRARVRKLGSSCRRDCSLPIPSCTSDSDCGLIVGPSPYTFRTFPPERSCPCCLVVGTLLTLMGARPPRRLSPPSLCLVTCVHETEYMHDTDIRTGVLISLRKSFWPFSVLRHSTETPWKPPSIHDGPTLLPRFPFVLGAQVSRCTITLL